MYEYSTEGLVADAVPVSGAFVAPCGLRGGRAWDLTSDLQTLPRLWVGVLGSWMRRTKHIFVSNMEGCTVRFALQLYTVYTCDGWLGRCAHVLPRR